MLHFILMTSSSTTAIIFTQMNHPLAMGFMLLIQTLLICILTGLTAHSFWFSYMLFLVFLGGLLVLFIYVTSLASNELFSLFTPSIVLTLGIMSMTLLFTFLVDCSLWAHLNHSHDMLPSTLPPIQNEETSSALQKLYNNPTGIVTLMLALYLFLTLIAAVKITQVFAGPLRPKN
uniref:NADH-ubiquinone oxidoreductase chain 6 n=1 Tax=Claassenia magna TaxID=2898275 RepID=A0A6B9PA13_9NEOP|nr:NADH dehydrogenase subunit 6 [Claassenia magna]WHU31447.1 NADH dehydrogenase subunit 6 [Claassenia magna]